MLNGKDSIIRLLAGEIKRAQYKCVNISQKRNR